MGLSDALWAARSNLRARLAHYSRPPFAYDKKQLKRVEKILRDMEKIQHELDTPPGSKKQ